MIAEPSESNEFWDNPANWSGGVVPDDPTVDVIANPVPSSTPGQYTPLDLSILDGESYTIGSLQVSPQLTLQLSGSLSVAGNATVGTMTLADDTFSASSLTIDGVGVSGSGSVDVTGTLDNNSDIYNNGKRSRNNSYGQLRLSRQQQRWLSRRGREQLDRQRRAGRLRNLVDGTLTEGGYQAFAYDGTPGVLSLNVGCPITTDDANIDLGGGVIRTFDPTTGQYAVIEQTLRSVGSTGMLEIGTSDRFSHSITVAGTLNLSASLWTAGLSLTTSGIVNVGNGYLPGVEIDGPVQNDGAVIVAATDSGGTGELLVTGDLAGSGSIALESSVSGFVPTETAASLVLGGAASNTIDFTVGAGTLTLDDPLAFTGAISGFSGEGAGENGTLEPETSIILQGIALGSVTSTSYTGTASGGSLTINEDGGTISLRFDGAYSSGDFALTASQDGSSTIITEVTPCYASGTMIATEEGDMPVEPDRRGYPCAPGRRRRRGGDLGRAPSGPISVASGADQGHSGPHTRGRARWGSAASRSGRLTGSRALRRGSAGPGGLANRRADDRLGAARDDRLSPHRAWPAWSAARRGRRGGKLSRQRQSRAIRQRPDRLAAHGFLGGSGLPRALRGDGPGGTEAAGHSWKAQ